MSTPRFWMAQRKRRWLALALPLLLFFPTFASDEVRGARTSPSAGHLDVRVPRGLIDATSFLREASDPLDVVQDASFDRSGIITGMSERRAYLARPQARGMALRFRGLVEERQELVRRLTEAATTEQLAASCRDVSFQWFLVGPEVELKWPDFALRPIFESDGYRVYRLERTCLL